MKTDRAQSPKILIVEDHPTDRIILSRIIEKRGLGRVIIADDGLKGFNTCFQENPDVLLLDLELPTLRGEEILRMLRSSTQYKRLPIIII